MHLVVTDLREKYCLNIPAVGPKHGSTKPATATSGALILAVLSALLLMAAHPAHAQTETVLYSFGSQSGDGASPYDTPIMDKEGNLYGTTLTGGTVNWGTVFKVTSSGEESVLYSFGSQSGDGDQPYAGLIMDKEGNLYGTTSGGGAYDSGIVFKVTPTGEETVLHSFCSQGGSYCPDGCFPLGGLIMDKKGNLYGTTNG